jgi:hypothetical protein
VGDVVEVWWKCHRDTVLSLEPYRGALEGDYGWEGARIARFASGQGMTIFSDDRFILIAGGPERAKRESAQGGTEGAKWPRVETIKCPKCGVVQQAQVVFEKWMPFPAYVHECAVCGYTITESEWERVEEGEEAHSLRSRA